MKKTNSRGKSSSTKPAAKSAAKKSSSGRSASSSSRSMNSGASRTASKSAAAKKSAPAKGRTAAKSSASRSKAKASSPKEDLEKVFKDVLKDIYYAEKQLQKALGKMSRAASNQELKDGFAMHQQETAGQIEKLDQVFEILGMRAQGKKCPAMDGLVEEGGEAIEEFDKGPARDAALIASAQKAEHYEISTYGTLRSFAEVIGEDECARIFEEILEQESATDEKLTMISQTVNQEAMDAGEGEEEEEMMEEEA